MADEGWRSRVERFNAAYQPFFIKWFPRFALVTAVLTIVTVVGYVVSQ